MALITLPTELLIQIMETLVLPQLDMEFPFPTEAFVQNRRALSGLCLSSYKLMLLARPRLYQNIVLYVSSREALDYEFYEQNRSDVCFIGDRSLELLLRTLVQQPSLRGLIRYIGFPNITFPSPLERFPFGIGSHVQATAIARCWSRFQSCFSNLSGVDRRLFALTGISKTYIHDDSTWSAWLSLDVAQRLLSTLICMAPNLESIMIPVTDDRPYEIMEEIIGAAQKDEVLGSGILSKLQEINFTVVPWKLPDYIMDFPLGTCPVLFRHAGIKRFHFYNGARGQLFSSATKLRELDSWWANLEELKIRAPLSTWQIHDICRIATKLQVLHIEIVCDIYISRPDVTLSDAIRQSAPTLEELLLDAVQYGMERGFGPQGRLEFLDCTRNLRVLHIGLHVLLGNSKYSKGLLLPELLPPNLRELGLRASTKECWYDQWILEQLPHLASVRAERLPSLTSVEMYSVYGRDGTPIDQSKLDLLGRYFDKGSEFTNSETTVPSWRRIAQETGPVKYVLQWSKTDETIL